MVYRGPGGHLVREGAPERSNDGVQDVLDGCAGVDARSFVPWQNEGRNGEVENPSQL